MSGVSNAINLLSTFQYPPLMVISGGPDNFTVSGYLVDGLTVLGDAVNIE